MRHDNEICDPRYYLFMEKESGGHVGLLCAVFLPYVDHSSLRLFSSHLTSSFILFILISHFLFVSSLFIDFSFCSISRYHHRL